MYYPANTLAKFKFSIYAASAISYLLHKQRDAVGLCLFSDKIDEFTPIKSTPTHLDKLFQLLERAIDQEGKEPKPTKVSGVLHEIAEKTHRRSLVVVFSDMFDGDEDPNEIFKALQHLKHNKHEVLLFHVTDHQTELEFNFEERPYEFIDLESREKIKLNPADIRERFTTHLTAFHKELKLKCNQLKIDFISANSHSDYAEVLQAYLIKRSKMR
jgi:uncharacterized protein (DUF58 family)